jgi:4-amino-4-deoxy-L-arabinose transferase-like glycosyltransferase
METMRKHGPRRTRVLLAGLVLLALIVRGGAFAAEPHPYDSAGLAAAHGELARNIVSNGKWFVVNLEAQPVVREPQQREHRLVDPATLRFGAADAHPRYQPVVLQPVGEGVVLAGLWAITGDQRYLYVQLLQVALDSVMVLLVFWICLTLYRRRRAAWIAAFLYAVFIPAVVIARIPHLDIWAVDFTILIVALLVRARVAIRPIPWLIAAGVATGLGVYFRPGVALVPVLLALATWRWSDWRDALRLGGVPVLVAALLMVPWTIRNENEFHRFIPTRIGIGQNLWEGLGEVHNDFGALLDDDQTARQVARMRPDLHYGTPAYDAYLEDKATSAIVDHPDHFARVVARRAFITTVGLRNLAMPIGIVEPILFVLAVAAAIWTRRRFAESHVLLASVIVATIAPYLVLHVEPRYVLPASFVYLIWLAVGIDLAAERRAARARHEAPALA